MRRATTVYVPSASVTLYEPSAPLVALPLVCAETCACTVTFATAAPAPSITRPRNVPVCAASGEARAVIRNSARLRLTDIHLLDRGRVTHRQDATAGRCEPDVFYVENRELRSCGRVLKARQTGLDLCPGRLQPGRKHELLPKRRHVFVGGEPRPV